MSSKSDSRHGEPRRWRGRGHKKGHDGTQHQQGFKRAQSTKDSDDANDNSPITKAFRGYQMEMDERNDRFERIMKLNRDITIESKRLIFLLQRVNGGSDDGEALLSEAEEKMKELHSTKFLALAKELKGQEIYQYLKACTGGLQEYIEAVTFYHYLKAQKLVPMETIQSHVAFDLADSELKDNENIVKQVAGLETSDVIESQTKDVKGVNEANTANQEPVMKSDQASDDCTSSNTSVGDTFSKKEEGMTVPLCVPILPAEYMLGVADFTGELMRMAINSVGAGDLETPKLIADTMRILHDAFSTLSNTTREMRRKTTVLRQSLSKVEKACYTLKVRGSEIPKHMLTDVFSNFAGPSDSFIADDANDNFD